MHHFQVVTPIILLFHESQPEKRVNHSIKPTAGGASSMVNPLTGHTLRLEFLRTKSGTVGLQNQAQEIAKKGLLKGSMLYEK